MEFIDSKYMDKILKRWKPLTEGIKDPYIRKTTSILLENQAKSVLVEQQESIKEAFATGDSPTTVGKLGTFQKFSFGLVRRVFPKLIANYIVGVQPMQGPVSQIFYLGFDRVGGPDGGVQATQTVYSKYNLTYRGMETSSIFGNVANIDGDQAGNINLSSLLGSATGSNPAIGTPSTTFGGQIAMWPNTNTLLGYTVSVGERLSGSAIAELNMHIEQQAVQARTRKMRALWTIEGAQDLKAYHNLDMESELTDLLHQELTLEIDRELIEDLRMIAYDISGNRWGFSRTYLDQPNSNKFDNDGTGFAPSAYLYDFANVGQNNPVGTRSNVYLIDLTSSSLPFAPRHVGDVYANIMGVLNIASQDIYKTTLRGPGTWFICAPIIAALLETASKLEGGIAPSDRPTNMGPNSIEYKGKFAGKYDVYVDPLFPEDEILMGYRGNNPMDQGYIYAPYIPLQALPTVTDPLTFQPRKGILTRYGKASITPESRFYRIIRMIGPISNYLIPPYRLNTYGTIAN